MPVRLRRGGRGVTVSVRWALSLALLGPLSGVPAASGDSEASPIEHVVIIYLENHSFDNVLGRLCVHDRRCDGATEGFASDGTRVPLRRADDIVPGMSHGVETQAKVINGGLMNGWDLIDGCAPETGYSCYQGFRPDQIPSMSALARQFALSDRTFEMDPIPTFGAHLELVTAQLAGFKGEHPDNEGGAGKASSDVEGRGWGCDSGRSAPWAAAPTDPYLAAPSCVPAPDGSGPFRDSPVKWVPTIMDRMDEAGLEWKMYAPQIQDEGYIWATCPYFAECLNGPQREHYVPYQKFPGDAAAGNLPSLSLVLPDLDVSQHNHASMLVGDNWLAEQVDAVMSGPDWGSTAIFITYDDCGCFYDHVTPPPGLGIRVPMVIVSPYAKAGFTDSTDASYASMLAFTEHTFGLEPLWISDATAYDYANSFDYSQEPLGPIELRTRPVPAWVTEWVKDHPSDPDDPT